MPRQAKAGKRESARKTGCSSFPLATCGIAVSQHLIKLAKLAGWLMSCVTGLVCDSLSRGAVYCSCCSISLREGCKQKEEANAVTQYSAQECIFYWMLYIF